MDEIFINTYNLPEWLVKKYFNEKDFYSIEELIRISIVLTGQRTGA